MKRTTVSIVLCTLIATTSGLADQVAFDMRREQSLQPHDFDVKHYRIALTIKDDTQSFTGETHITFSSLMDGLDSMTLNTVNFTVGSVIDDHGNSLEFIQNDAA